jgi:hypothetical protein
MTWYRVKEQGKFACSLHFSLSVFISVVDISATSDRHPLTCASYDCVQGYQCVMEHVVCKKAPCLPSPRYVSGYFLLYRLLCMLTGEVLLFQYLVRETSGYQACVQLGALQWTFCVRLIRCPLFSTVATWQFYALNSYLTAKLSRRNREHWRRQSGLSKRRY